MPSSEKTSKRTLNRPKKGRLFEKQAEEFFIKNKYQIVDKNWRYGRKEIDLIVKKGDLLVFVEVKGSVSTKFGHPVLRVNPKKIKNMTDVAQAYLETKGIRDNDLRFDIVTFINGELEHFPDAFRIE